VSAEGTQASIDGDPWLDRYLPMIVARSATRPVLELGCGGGRDTRTLADAGCRVVAIDASAAAIERARLVAPATEFHCQDLRAAWPAAVARVDVVVASLSLHYFAWVETTAIVARIGAALTPGGVLLCRVNSTNDVHFGARGHPPIEANYYSVDGQPKRFFDRAAVDALFATGWNLRHVEERVVMRYTHPKALWEIIAVNGVTSGDG
jgi:SAM-dependent methyltransferase